MPPTEPLFDAARVFAADCGTEPAEITVRMKNGSTFVSPVPESKAREGGSVRADILLTLREVGGRLTTSEVLLALDKADRLWGESTVRHALAEMVKDGELTNKREGKPKGYGLAEE